MIGMPNAALSQALPTPKNTCYSTWRCSQSGFTHGATFLESLWATNYKHRFRAKRVLAFGPITPAHRKPPWPGYKQSLRLFTKLIAEHPLVGICRPPDLPVERALKQAEHMGAALYIRGHSAGSYAGMVWETVLAEFPNIEGRTDLAAIAFPPSFLTKPSHSYKRQLHLIHHADDRLCVWTPLP